MADEQQPQNQPLDVLAAVLDALSAAAAESRLDLVQALAKALRAELSVGGTGQGLLVAPLQGVVPAGELAEAQARTLALGTPREAHQPDGPPPASESGPGHDSGTEPGAMTPQAEPNPRGVTVASPAKRRGPGRRPAAVEPAEEALIQGFGAWLTKLVPRLDPKTIRGRVSFLRKLAFVANQSGRGLLEVERDLFELAARARFSPSDYGQIIEGRASVSATNTAKTAMRNFVEYVRTSGIGPDWADATRGASLPKAGGRTEAPKSIPWDVAEEFLAASAELAQTALEAHRRDEKAALDRFDNRLPLWPLRVVVGYVALLTFHLSGLRMEELVGLRTYDIMFGPESHLKVYTAKNDKPRTVSIGARLVAALRWYLKEVRPLVPGATDSDRLFLDCGAKKRRGTFPEDAVRLTDEWFWVRFTADTPLEGTRWHPHIARHTYATGLIDHGTALGIVQVQMGHENLETTAIYTRPRPAMIQRSAASMDGLAGEAERDLFKASDPTEEGPPT